MWLKQPRRFSPDLQNDLPSFSFSSVFYDLQSLATKSAKAVFKVKAIFDSVHFPVNQMHSQPWVLGPVLHTLTCRGRDRTVRWWFCEGHWPSAALWTWTGQQTLLKTDAQTTARDKKMAEELNCVRVKANTHRPSPAAHWTAAGVHVLHTPPHRGGL